MKVYSIHDERFKKYGFVLAGYDYTELFEALKEVPMPVEGIDYVASLESLENCAAAKEMEIRGFGAMPVQLGYVSGRARQMNGLEYHKSSEYNIPMNDVIVLLGMQQDIVDGKYDSSKCEAFLIPARRATSATVTGLSPEMTFTATSLSLNHLIVSIASGRMLSERVTIASAFMPTGNLSPWICPVECAITSTRSPICAYCFTILSIRVGIGFKTNSGAPMTNVPAPSKVTAESFRADENGRVAIGCKAAE